MGEAWKVVLTTGNPAQAEILRGLLEAQGIPAAVWQEAAARALGLTVGPFGELRVAVPAGHYAAAQAVVQAFLRGDFADGAEP